MDRDDVMQLVRSFQVGHISRRVFLHRASLALGSAASAQLLLTACSNSPVKDPPPVVIDPVEGQAGDDGADAAPTEPESVEASIEDEAPQTGMLDYGEREGQVLRGYLAKQERVAKGKAIVLIQEWWGLNAHIVSLARRLADEGYVVLAPDLYHGVVVSEPDEARKQVMELDQAAAVEEIDAAAAYLLGRDDVVGETVGVVGFCMGGGLTLQTTLVSDLVGGAVAFYGRPLTPEEAPNAKAPILGLFGSDDGGIPREEVREMEAALDEAGIINEIVIYDGAGHAFFNDTRESFHAEAAEDAWTRTLGWFEAYL